MASDDKDKKKSKKEKKEKKRRKYSSDSEQEKGRTQSASSRGLPCSQETKSSGLTAGASSHNAVPNGHPGVFPAHTVPPPSMMDFMQQQVIQQQVMMHHMMMQQQMLMGDIGQVHDVEDKGREKVKDKSKKKKKKRKRESSSESREVVRSPQKIIRRTNFSEAPPPPPGPPPPPIDPAVEKERRMLELMAAQEAKKDAPQMAEGIAAYLATNNINLDDVWEPLKRLTAVQQTALIAQGPVVGYNQPTQVFVQRIHQIQEQDRQERFTPKVDLIGPSLEEQLREMNDRDEFESKMALKDARREKKQLALQNTYEQAAITGEAIPLGRQLSIAELLELEDMAKQQLEDSEPGALSQPALEDSRPVPWPEVTQPALEDSRPAPPWPPAVTQSAGNGRPLLPWPPNFASNMPMQNHGAPSPGSASMGYAQPPSHVQTGYAHPMGHTPPGSNHAGQQIRESTWRP